jgi:hypothetical protein
MRNFSPDERVYVYNENLSNSLGPHYEGSATVIEKLGTNTYVVDHQGKHQKVNIRRLAKYYDKDRPFSVNVDGGTQTPSGEPTAGGTPDTGTTDTEWITVRGEPSQSSSDTVPTQRELNQHANPSVRSVAEASRTFW